MLGLGLPCRGPLGAALIVEARGQEWVLVAVVAEGGSLVQTVKGLVSSARRDCVAVVVVADGQIAEHVFLLAMRQVALLPEPVQGWILVPRR